MRERDGTRVLVVQVCQDCGAEFPIWRRRSRLKGDDHLKDLYCPTCMRVTKHRQRREY